MESSSGDCRALAMTLSKEVQIRHIEEWVRLLPVELSAELYRHAAAMLLAYLRSQRAEDLSLNQRELLRGVEQWCTSRTQA